jgi:hypothetical protein
MTIADDDKNPLTAIGSVYRAVIVIPRDDRCRSDAATRLCALLTDAA